MRAPTPPPRHQPRHQSRHQPRNPPRHHRRLLAVAAALAPGVAASLAAGADAARPASSASSAAGAAAIAAARPPNILFLLLDDARTDEFGFAGNPVIQTPNIDRLAARGTVFANAFVTTAICVVSRASIFTGQHGRAHGIWDFSAPFGRERWARAYPRLLREAGYFTGLVGKFGVGGKPEDLPSDDFDFWRSRPGNLRYFEKHSPEHLTKRIGDQSLEFLAAAPAGRPWCLSVGFKAPHAQDRAPREFPPDARDEALYRDAAIAPPPAATEAAFAGLPESVQQSEGRKRWRVRFATDDMALATTRDIYRLIAGVDREVGRLLDDLARRGMLDNTLVVFTSDNGFALGERGMSDKWYMFEEDIRVPLVIVPPGALGAPPPSPSPRRADCMALNIDLAPTLLDYAGVPAPDGTQGASLRAWVEGRRAPGWREDFYYEHRTLPKIIPPSEGVRGAKWKYIRWTNESPVREALFDLEADPLELNNLADSPDAAPRLQHLRARCATLRHEAGSPPGAEKPRAVPRP